MSVLRIPDMALVVLVGASGSGKSTFARRCFAATQILSSDAFRAMVADDENDQSATRPAFEALQTVAGKRLEGGRVTVIDATSVKREDRAHLVTLAREHHVLPVAIVLDVPGSTCLERNAARTDRDIGAHVVRRQRADLHRGVGSLTKEGFRRVHVLSSVAEVDAATVEVEPLLNDRRGEAGPFDLVGDVHGCADELLDLLDALGYVVTRDGEGRAVGARHPAGRRAVFVGDLVDRGPDTPGVLRLVMGMVADGDALCVCGNHEQKLARALAGRKVTVNHGLAESLEQLAAQPEGFRERARAFCDDLVAHLVLDGGQLVVAHAGLPERFHGRASGAVRSFALFGDTTGETGTDGLPVRRDWAREYRGRAAVVYGHTPVEDAQWVNGTICLDTGAVFGGRLTALRWPERELVDVPTERVWCEPARPLRAPEPGRVGDAVQWSSTRGDEPDVLALDDVTGKRRVETAHHGPVTVPAEQAAAALEVMSRFAIDPRRLVYLPPTMAPAAASTRDDLLEHPAEAFAAYRDEGLRHVVCQEKHMGSRAVLLVCRDDPDGTRGSVVTRTGRAFFPATTGAALLARVAAAVTIAGLWDELGTARLVLDAEVLPWDAKAGGLVRERYAAVGAAGGAGLRAAGHALAAAGQRGVDVADLADRTRRRAAEVAGFRAAYRRYCWPTDGLDGVALAPFGVLAGAEALLDRPQRWHLALADRLADADPALFRRTAAVEVDVDDDRSVAAATAWWEDLTADGGEGMVVKPCEGLARGRRGLAQPGLKVRGREYLRLVYGPEYTEPANLERLRERSVRLKRSLALREYALGVEALERFARGEPLWRVHECVFAVLALESVPVDPRL